MNRADYTKEECWAVADELAKERLSAVNASTKEVIPTKSFYTEHGKRLLDIGISAIALIITAPINLGLLVGTYLDVGSPVLFKQQRVGKDGQPFTVVKFRNMTNEVDASGELLPAAQRVTRFGNFVRRTSLDELLNFWSVFKGDMSIIGPRPLLPEYTDRYSNRHRMRLSVRPGLECPPRTMETERHTWQDQFENDVWYVEHVSLKTDIRMCINLVRFAINPNASKARGAAKKTAFMGYDENGVAIDLDSIPDEYAKAILEKKGCK